jgi:hypothetical protein
MKNGETPKVLIPTLLLTYNILRNMEETIK